MMKHIVLLRFDPLLTDSEIQQAFIWLQNLRLSIPQIKSFNYGKYDSQEGMNQEFEYGFEMTFDSAKDRDIYLYHPEHLAVGKRIIALLKDGTNSLIAFDYQTARDE